MSHRLVVVIGPSGAGKDSVLDGVRANWSFCKPAHFARRTITRPVKFDDEQHEAVDVASFEQMLQAQTFCMHWHANGISYGIRKTELDPINIGQWVFINGSRAYLPELLKAWPLATVVHISAAHEVLAQRLVQRGRESGDAMVKRLSRNVALNLPAHAISIDNSSTLEEAVSSLTRALKMRIQRV